MKKIKILFFSDARASAFNAQDLNTREIVNRLDPSQFQITLFNKGLEGETIFSAYENAENVVVISGSKKGIISKLIKRVRWFVYTYIKRYDFHFYVRTYFTKKYWFLKKCMFNSTKTITVVENMLPYPADELYNRKAKYNANHSDYIVGISEFIGQQIQEFYNRKASAIISVGVDTSRFVPIEHKNERLKILCVGTFQKRKRPLFFFEVAKQFSQCDFIWIGEGALKQQAIDKIKNENINNAYVMDNMPHQNLAKYMAGCDVFFMPSIHEGTPKVMVEAMACKVPVVALNYYKPDFVVHNETGFLAQNDEELLEDLKKIIDKNSLREEMGNSSLRRSKQFDWNSIVEKWSLFFKENNRL